MSGKIRKGAGYSWSVQSDHSYKGSSMLRSTYGYTIDDLNTKNLDEAENTYEKVFILVRKALEFNENLCCDDENDRLNICQIIADTLKQNSVLSK